MTVTEFQERVYLKYISLRDDKLIRKSMFTILYAYEITHDTFYFIVEQRIMNYYLKIPEE